MAIYLSSLEKLSQEKIEVYLRYNHELILTLETSTYLHKSSHWIKCWNEAFAKIREKEGKEFWVFHFYSPKNENPEPIGVFFLTKQTKMGVSFWNSAGKLFGSPGPVIKDGFQKEFAENLFLKLKEENKYYFMDLAPCIEDWITPSLSASEIKSNRKIFNIEISDYTDAPYIELNKYTQPISKKMNSNLSRLKRNFLRDNIDYKHTVAYGSDAKKYIDQLAKMHSLEWPSSIFNVGNNVYKNFFEKLTEENNEIKVRVDSLFLENNLAAIVFGITIKNRYYYLAPTYNIQYAKYSPGSLLIQEILVSLKQEDFHIFDFMNSLESYKLKWTSDVQKRQKYIFYSSKFLAPNLIYFRQRILYKMKFMFLKKFPNKIQNF